MSSLDEGEDVNPLQTFQTGYKQSTNCTKSTSITDFFQKKRGRKQRKNKKSGIGRPRQSDGTTTDLANEGDDSNIMLLLSSDKSDEEKSQGEESTASTGKLAATNPMASSIAEQPRKQKRVQWNHPDFFFDSAHKNKQKKKVRQALQSI